MADSPGDRDNKLFIGMLPKTLGEEDLQSMFSVYGELREVHLIRGPDGAAKGCAFVKFVERDAAVAAIDNLNDTIPMVRTEL
jgi:CUG-BP- and ETR3-like factor